MDSPDRLTFAASRSRWLAPLTGGLPKIPQRETLPTPSADLAFRMVVIPGGAGAADVFYVCLKSAADVYGWKVAATG